MAEKKYYWLKLKRDFFKRHDIQIIEAMENGKDYILFYLKLLCESVDHEGNLRFSEQIPYNEQMLATITNTNVDVVRNAIKIFTELGMIDILDDGTFYMSEVNRLLGSETKWAEKKRKQRELPKLTNGSTRINGEMLRLPDGSTRYVDEKRYGGNGMLVLDRAKGKCEICGSDENVVIHHNKEYSNDPNDLICLCAKCHGKVHSEKIGGTISPTCLPFVQQEKEIEIEKEKEKDTEIEKENISEDEPPTPTPSTEKSEPRHKYGEYKHVLLKDSEIDKLKEEYGLDMLEDCITFLDEYIEMKGYKAKNHYLCIRKWVVDAVKERQRKQSGNNGNAQGRLDWLDNIEY